MTQQKPGVPARVLSPHVLRAISRPATPGVPIQAKPAPLPAAHVRQALVLQRAAATSSSSSAGAGSGSGSGGGKGGSGGPSKWNVNAKEFVFVAPKKKGPTIQKSMRYRGDEYERCVAFLQVMFAGQDVTIFVTNGMHELLEDHQDGAGPHYYEYFGYAVGEDLDTKKVHHYTGNFR